jgi:predicted RNA-binding Zn ribbon-like protein
MRGYDVFDSPEDTSKWLEEVDYGSLGCSIGEGELARLRNVRESLRGLLLAHNPGMAAGKVKSDSRINEQIGACGLDVRFDPNGQPFLVPSCVGVERVVQDILISVVRAGYEGTWQRLKACASEDCQWSFYDTSKNRSGSWCVMEICGSRAKMHRYRHKSSARQTLLDSRDTSQIV